MKSLNIYKIVSLLVLLTLTLSSTFAQECDNDTVAPSAVCESELQVAAIEDYGALIWAYDIDEGSFDLCSPVDLFVTTLADDTGTAPTTRSVLLPAELGTYPVILYAVDEAGNENTCITNVTVAMIVENQCPGDEEPPSLLCINGITVALFPTATIWATDIMAQDPTDNCTANPSLSINLSSESTGAPQGSPSITFTEVGLYDIEVWVMDELGNSTFCSTYVIVQAGPDCQGDVTPPVAICDNEIQVVAVEDYGATISATTVDDGSFDTCSSVSLFITTEDDDTGTVPPTTTILLPPELGTTQVVLYTVDEAGNENTCWTDITVTDIFPGDCTDDDEAPEITCRELVVGYFFNEENTLTVFAENFVADLTDNCDLSPTITINLQSESTGAPQGSPSYTADQIGAYVLEVWAEDDTGNAAVCISTLAINSNSACLNDEEAPTAICQEAITASAIPDFGLIVWAHDLDEGSNDNCGDLQLFVVASEDDTGVPPTTTSVQLPPELGTYTLVLYAVDASGNFNSCSTEVTIEDLANDGCLSDTEAPIINCLTGLNATLDPITFSVTVDADFFVSSVIDNCTASPALSLNLLANSTGSPSGNDELIFTSTGAGREVEVWAVDDFGNTTSCLTSISINTEGADCFPDTNIPIAQCVEGLTVWAEPIIGVEIWAEDIDAGSIDWCTIHQVDTRIVLQEDSDGTFPFTSSITLPPEAGVYSVELWVSDPSGNLNVCSTEITVAGIINCDDDTNPPVAICDEILTVSTFTTDEIVVEAQTLDDGSYDDCSTVEFRIVLEDESDGTLPSTSSIIIPSIMGDFNTELWVVDAAGNTNVCTTVINVNNVYHPIAGVVYQDLNDNCMYDDEEADTGFSGWIVRATDIETGISETTTTTANGSYGLFLNLPDDNPRDIEVELLLPDGLSTGCVTSILLEDYLNFNQVAHFALGLAEDCDYLTVDVATPFLRRCFSNDITVSYTNFSGAAVDDVTVEVQLDPLLAIQSASLPYTALGDGAYLFELGTVEAATNGQFLITAILSCEAALGATHCLEATIEPFTCLTDEDFAELVITGECDELGNEVHFTVSNTGNGTMTNAQQIRIVEDVIMYMNGNPIQLDAGGEEELSFPANGATWRLEIPQDPSFPFGGVAAAFVEGCGGFNPGIATQFTLGNSNPNIDQLCLENIGAYDPNDKQALPKGYGAEHYIEANTPLEYLIRFQNTGTDTAFNVRIEDQLSEYLDPSTLVPGASSHPYRVELKEDGLLSFHFDNIMLPDSNVNLAASNGFVQFSIQQLPDNPLNTIIENTAGIYFDFNDPVITNTVWHTIGEDFILVQSHEVLQQGLALRIAPNPIQTFATLTLEGTELQKAWCTIYDSQGRLVTEIALSGNTARIDRELLPQDGVYFFRIRSANELLAQGKLIAQ